MEIRMKRPFEAVYGDYFSYVYNIMYMHVLNRETAEDLTSEAFIKAFSAYAQYDPARAGEKTWLANIANHLIIDHYRKRASNKVDTVDDEVLSVIADGADPFNEDGKAVNQAVCTLLLELDAEERRLLSLRYYEDMKNPEIGALLGINAKAVSERYRRLTEKCRKIAERKKLREML